jgi:protein-ribulosamine 3-kinase
LIHSYENIEDALFALYGENTVETSRKTVSGGCINDASVLLLSNKERVFLKENTAELTNMFAAEAEGLDALHTASSRMKGPIVPKPLAVGGDRGRQFILMEYIATGRPGPQWAEELGRSLARLHLDRLETRFGFAGDNYIGATPQPNPWTDGWISFFSVHRLGFQIDSACRRGLASFGLEKDVRRLIEYLDRFIPDNCAPSLLHGDLWSGNAMADKNGDAVIIDPATYYGHNEADLAMTELFGRFPERFYFAYSEVLPISSEYADRKTVYGLYHILNHLNLFGMGYAAQASQMARSLL